MDGNFKSQTLSYLDYLENSSPLSPVAQSENFSEENDQLDNKNSISPISHVSPQLATSEDSDDSTPLAQLIGNIKKENTDTKSKKSKTTKKRKKRDPNEPQKPISAYALFFKDTQAAIKGQNPYASFGEVSKIVASMWESLDIETKNSYKRKTAAAKKEYAKALAEYRASLTAKCSDNSETMEECDYYDNNEISVKQEPLSPQQMDTTDDNTQESYKALPPPDNSQSNSPTYSQEVSPANSDESHSNDIKDEESSIAICLREGCSNPAIDSPDWDREYCSIECVVVHCKNVFTKWATERKALSFSIK